MARIVFDLDGTLIDSAPDIHGVANRLLSEEGAVSITLDEARDFIGNGASVFVSRMRAARGIPASAHDRLLARFVASYDTAVTLTRPYPGVSQTLHGLRTAGHSLGICTNKPLRATRAVLAHLGLASDFATVWGGDSLSVHKPDPAPLHAAFAALGSGAQIYVGDSDVDAETAERAGVPFLLFTEGYRKSPVEALKHHAAFDHFAELPDLVEQITEMAR